MMQSTPKRSLDLPDPDPDSQCAKAPRSTLNLRPKSGSPLLMLSLEEGGCRLYSPDEERIYETKSDFSGYRFLGNSGKWFLAVDSGSKLSIVDVFSEKRIDLPPLELIKDGRFKVERLGDKQFEITLIGNTCGVVQPVEDLRGVLWVDDKNGDYVVVWQFQCNEFVAFCKNGDDQYREITTRIGAPLELQGLYDMVLKSYSLYFFTKREYIRHLDLSGQDGFKDVSKNHRFPMWAPDRSGDEYARFRANKIISITESIAVTTSGDILYVHTNAYETPTLERPRTFHVYKWDPKDLDPSTIDTKLFELDSLGDEALFLDLGITVKVDAEHTHGIEPNSIYFTRGDRIRHEKISCMDICVYNLETKTTKRFPSLSKLNVKDAQWFLPS